MGALRLGNMFFSKMYHFTAIISLHAMWILPPQPAPPTSIFSDAPYRLRSCLDTFPPTQKTRKHFHQQKNSFLPNLCKMGDWVIFAPQSTNYWFFLTVMEASNNHDLIKYSSIPIFRTEVLHLKITQILFPSLNWGPISSSMSCYFIVDFHRVHQTFFFLIIAV